MLGNPWEGNPARYGVIVGIGAFVTFELVTPLWGTIGFASTIMQAFIFGAVVGALCFAQSWMHPRTS